MGFFSDLKFVKNYLNAQFNIDEFEATVSKHRENIKGLNSKVFNLSIEVEELTEKKDDLKESIEALYKEKRKCEEGINKIYSLEAREFIQELMEKGYEFYKLNLEEELESKTKCYITPLEIKRAIEMHIQEFSIMENLDFDYLREILYSVNKVWSENYKEIKNPDVNLYNDSIMKILLNFMILRRKEISEIEKKERIE